MMYGVLCILSAASVSLIHIKAHSSLPYTGEKVLRLFARIHPLFYQNADDFEQVSMLVNV